MTNQVCFFTLMSTQTWWGMLQLKRNQVDFDQKISLHLPPTIVLPNVQELTIEVNTTKKTQQSSSFWDNTSTFFSFSDVVSQDHHRGWTESESRDGMVRWGKLYTMWWLIIHVAVSRVWALVLCSEALVHVITLLTPPGRLVPPACGVRSNQKALLPLSRAFSLKIGYWNSKNATMQQEQTGSFNLLRLYSP